MYVLFNGLSCYIILHIAVTSLWGSQHHHAHIVASYQALPLTQLLLHSNFCKGERLWYIQGYKHITCLIMPWITPMLFRVPIPYILAKVLFSHIGITECFPENLPQDLSISDPVFDHLFKAALDISRIICLNCI